MSGADPRQRAHEKACRNGAIRRLVALRHDEYVALATELARAQQRPDSPRAAQPGKLHYEAARRQLVKIHEVEFQQLVTEAMKPWRPSQRRSSSSGGERVTGRQRALAKALTDDQAHELLMGAGLLERIAPEQRLKAGRLLLVATSPVTDRTATEMLRMVRLSSNPFRTLQELCRGSGI
jgi:hypothetical protein